MARKKNAKPTPGEESWADKIKRARKERGLSQVDLAEKSGVHAITIARIETGQHQPQGETLRKLTETLEKIPKLPVI